MKVRAYILCSHLFFPNQRPNKHLSTQNPSSGNEIHLQKLHSILERQPKRLLVQTQALRLGLGPSNQRRLLCPHSLHPHPHQSRILPRKQRKPHHIHLDPHSFHRSSHRHWLQNRRTSKVDLGTIRKSNISLNKF